MRSVRTLLHGLIDYAGLFPPAGLDLPTAVANYASYRASDTCWALGRFVIPAARLPELETSADPFLRGSGTPWKLAALAGADLTGDLGAIVQFNQRHGGRAVVDIIELKAGTTAAVAAALRVIDGRFDAYLEIPIANDPAPLIDALAALGGRAKVRTGGVTPEAFPPPADLLRFLRRCTAAGVPFKATAGLHHPLRGAYRLTYQPGSPCGVMFGFLNLFLAAAFVQHGMGDADALELLEESSTASLRVEQEGIGWRSHWLDDAELRHARRLAAAFGSCSFDEPIGDLRAMRLL
ncbi:MAG TPA: hypothetical protein VEL05_05100 [Candidatus Acidoferrum sp.]|nr:hypothetical protein [Candidatus Acidoferrum sp.]